MGKVWAWAFSAVVLCSVPVKAASFALGADVSALMFWDSDRWGAGINLYPGIDGGGGLVGELQVGYEIAHQSEFSAIYPIYIGVRYDFADIIGSNDWHPILAGHAGVSVLSVNAQSNPGTGLSTRAANTDAGLGGNVQIGIDYSDSNERAIGVQLQQNWAAVENGVTAKWLALGISGRVVF